MKKIILLFLLTAFVTACDTPETHIQREEVTFTIPKGWKIKQENTEDKNNYWVSLQKNGFFNENYIEISVENSEVDLQKWLNDIKNHILKEHTPISDEEKLHFSDIYHDEFNGKHAFTIDYTLVKHKKQYKSRIFTFHANKKSFCVLRFDVLNEITSNNNDFSILEKSFRPL